MISTECEVVMGVSRSVAIEYEVVRPYSTWVSDGSPVAHVIKTEFSEGIASMPEIAGAWVSDGGT